MLSCPYRTVSLREEPAMFSASRPSPPKKVLRLTKIWDRLYELYVEQANGAVRRHGDPERKSTALIKRARLDPRLGLEHRGNWKDDIPPDIREKLLRS